MNKEIKNLQSEQLPNDGGYHWHELIDEANTRLRKIGKHGKRATIKKVKPGKSMSIQFSLHGKQVNPGLDLSLNKNNLIKAEEICALITGQLVAGTFTMDWFYSLIGKSKKVTKPEKPFLTCGEMLEQYKIHFFKQREKDKSPDGNWQYTYRHTEKTFTKYSDQILNLKIIKETIECTKNNTPVRGRLLNGLASLLKHFDNNEFKQVIKRYKIENSPKRKDKYIPTDAEIVHVYQTGFEPSVKCPKKWLHRYEQWQFLYSLLATYGLRIHEAWSIKNWDEAVYLKKGDWVAIADDTEDINNENENEKYSYRQIEQDEIIPAILDPDNKDYLLCIGHETKTGYRVAFPISPGGIGKNCDWLEKFNLLQPMNLPDVENPLIQKHGTSSLNCTYATIRWFNPPNNYKTNKRKGTLKKETLRYGFTAHALRHAYNIRGHKLGLNQKMLADSLGHGLQMNSSNYMRHEQATSKIQGIKQEISSYSDQNLELERLRAKNKYLETEIEKLRTKLAMYEAIEQARKDK